MLRSASPAPVDVVSFGRQIRLLADDGDMLGLLARTAELARLAGTAPHPAELVAELGTVAHHSPPAAMAAIECLAHVPAPSADRALVDLLAHDATVVRRHAAWRLGSRAANRSAYAPLLGQLVLGGIDTLHAHRTLRRWATDDPIEVVRRSLERLARETEPAPRARIVDLLGVIPTDTDDLLVALADDVDESDAVRAIAIGALGERPHVPVDALLTRIGQDDGPLGQHAALALSARSMSRRGRPLRSGLDRLDRGLRVAQLVLVDGLDGQLSTGGRGETGGVASLLVSLADALARHPDVEHVLTIGRGTVTDALTSPFPTDRQPSSFATVSYGDPDRPAHAPDAAWEHLPAIERGIRRALRAAAPIDVLHLRMADGGTLAGAGVAGALGIETCFSVAPDPHQVIESLQARGEMSVSSFERLERDAHVWFRARLVERLAATADRLALFPRTRPLPMLAGIDPAGRPSATVAEGIDVRALDRAERRVHDASVLGGRIAVLDDLARRVPPGRRHLPLALTVGRLHPVKGVERVVAAWSTDPGLAERCNLVVVGGDLERPSPVEREVLDAIDALVPLDDPRRAGLVLLGGRPHADVAALHVATARGWPGGWAAGGIYVDGALKEEFGLAVLESLAAGNVVVAPMTGGPPTYVDDGETGVLAAPGHDLGVAMRRAFALVDRPGRAARARTTVVARYAIETMAARLVHLYGVAMAVR